jgi:hypothetical protein
VAVRGHEILVELYVERNGRRNSQRATAIGFSALPRRLDDGATLATASAFGLNTAFDSSRMSSAASG